MRLKDIKHILFLSFIVFLLVGCTSEVGKDHKYRVFICSQTNGKFLPNDRGSLANAAGLITKKMTDEPMPTALIYAGNSIDIKSDSDVKKAGVFAEAAQMIGFKANLIAEAELRDSAEFAAKRSELGWPQVISNIKPIDGTEPPATFENFYKYDIGDQRTIYLVNYIAERELGKYPLLADSYEYVRPAVHLEDFRLKVKPKDIVIANFINAQPYELINFFKKPVSERVAFSIIDSKHHAAYEKEESTPKDLRNARFVYSPEDGSSVSMITFSWNTVEEQWIIEQPVPENTHRYKPDPEILSFLKSQLDMQPSTPTMDSQPDDKTESVNEPESSKEDVQDETIEENENKSDSIEPENDINDS